MILRFILYFGLIGLRKESVSNPTAQELPIDGWMAADELEHASSERESKTTKEVVGIDVTGYYIVVRIRKY